MVMSHAQDHLHVLPIQETIYVSEIKTTHLIFDDGISYIDLGSPYFVADTLKSMIKIKHIGEDVKKPLSQITNLTVITKSGEYYSIPMRYKRDPEELTFRITSSKEKVKEVADDKNLSERKKQELEQFISQLKFAKPNMEFGNRREDFDINLQGIYYQKDYIALKISVYNTSTIDLDIDQILFRLKLKKRIAQDYIYQERLVEPIYIIDRTKKIKGYNTKTMTMIFKKFTPNENEDLFINIFENNGGRSSKLTVPRKRLLNPKVLRL